MTEAHKNTMFKKFLIVTVLLLPAMTFVSCGDDEPEITDPDPIEEPGSDPSGDDNPQPNPDPSDDDNPQPDPGPSGDDNPQSDNKQDDGDITINTDGSTSTGVPFRRIDETTFMLNYVKYSVVDGHIEVIGADDIEIGQSLNGHVKLYSSITIDGTSYNVRAIAKYSFSECSSLVSITIPKSVTNVGEEAFSDCYSLRYAIIDNAKINWSSGISNYRAAFRDCKSLAVIHYTNCATICIDYSKTDCMHSITELYSYTQTPEIDTNALGCLCLYRGYNISRVYYYPQGCWDNYSNSGNKLFNQEWSSYEEFDPSTFDYRDLIEE